MAAASTANGGNRALRLVRIDQARLAALLHAARQRGDAFDRVLPGALGAVCIGAAGSPADAMARMLAAAAPDLPLAPMQMALLDAGSHARAGAVCEIWQCDAPDLRSGRRGALQYRYSATTGLVFGSIVGHRTVHRGDVVAQTRETIANLAAVLEQAARQGHGPFALADLSDRVYVRDAGDAAALAAIERVLRDAAGSGVRPLFVHADVCRDDLLVEIEASAGHPMEHLS